MINFRIVIDHKPLESIIDKKTLNEVDSPRLQRLKEKLLSYGNFRTTWRAGKKNLIADAVKDIDKPKRILECTRHNYMSLQGTETINNLMG